MQRPRETVVAERLLNDALLADDPLAAELAQSAVAAFAAHGGDPVLAADEVDPLVRRIGVRFCREQADSQALRLAFFSVGRTAHEVLAATIPPARRLRARSLHDRVAELVSLLASRAEAALEREQRRGEVSEADGEPGALRQALFGHVTEDSLDILADADGNASEALLTPLVAVRGTLPDQALRARGCISGLVPSEVAVADITEVAATLAASGVQVVVGLPAHVRDFPAAVDLARKAARLLRSGRVEDGRTAIPCVDLLGTILMTPDPFISEVLSARRLAPLSGLSDSKRIVLGTTLLLWLESGLQVAQLATRMHEPPPTMYSRIHRLRTLFGNDLDRPDARCEIIAALRHCLPQWRDTAAKKLRPGL
ncbi:helix-turn-helix domain-containing protein [Nocardioides sp.]|uniref:PucR family transcriptional regulator n=1 Tax=Nocardioides sp. TaxID=35761 RepID=UPI002609D49D|nr:helix-turn-helix domain-containing protein [Nocardioides sp.]